VSTSITWSYLRTHSPTGTNSHTGAVVRTRSNPFGQRLLERNEHSLTGTNSHTGAVARARSNPLGQRLLVRDEHSLTGTNSQTDAVARARSNPLGQRLLVRDALHKDQLQQLGVGGQAELRQPAQLLLAPLLPLLNLPA